MNEITIRQAHGIPGFHSFRRFRITRLRELGTPEDIVRYWAGHQGAGITDRYSKLAENCELRKSWASRCGLGFDLPTGGPTSGKPFKHAKKPSARKDPQAEAVVKRPQPEAAVKAAPAEPYVAPYKAEDSDLDDFFRSTPEPVSEEVI